MTLQASANDMLTRVAWVNDMTATATFWTATPTPTATQTPTFTATVTPESTDTPVPSPTWTPDPLQTILAQARNFSGTNDDWEPFTWTFDGVEMVLVPAGCFMMGSNDGDDDENPPHEVCFDEPFWIDRTEVTNAQFVALGGRKVHSDAWVDRGENYPRDQIVPMEAEAFCGLRGARLPTEAEWEYAARGPDELVYPWGNAWEPSNVVWSGNSPDQPAEVGSKLKGRSWVGALDLSGNVWEMIGDRDDGYYSSPSNGYVLRGGSWFLSDAYSLRAANRGSQNAYSRSDHVGFRCARSS